MIRRARGGPAVACLAKSKIADAERGTIGPIDGQTPAGESRYTALVAWHLEIGPQRNLSRTGRCDKHGIGSCGKIFRQTEMIGLARSIGNIRWREEISITGLNETGRAKVDELAQCRMRVGSRGKEAKGSVDGAGR